MTALRRRMIEDMANIDTLLLFLEDGEAQHASRVVIDDTRHAPAERPELKNRKRQPRYPVSCSSRDQSQVGLPNVIRFFRLSGLSLTRLTDFSLAAFSSPSGSFRSRSLRIRVSHRRTQDLQSHDDVPNEIGEASSRIACL